MKDILRHIINTKQTEIATQKKPLFATLTDDCVERVPLSLKQAVANSESGIIAEFKRRSPSRGWINRLAKANVIPSAYEKAGATALSILTDERYFGGSIADMIVARAHVNIP